MLNRRYIYLACIHRLDKTFFSPFQIKTKNFLLRTIEDKIPSAEFHLRPIKIRKQPYMSSQDCEKQFYQNVLFLSCLHFQMKSKIDFEIGL